MAIIFHKNRTISPSRNGFTLIEILTVLFLVGIIALPFTNMFIFGYQGTHDVADHVLAYNIAREKIEEIKCLPFDLIQSDFNNFREVFQDRPNFEEAFIDKKGFKKMFTDIFTDRSLADDDNRTTWKRLQNLYPKAMLKKITTYPEDLRLFRRVVEVEPFGSLSVPKLKKVTVTIFDKEDKQIAVLSTLIGLHK
jgi:prepilin-type N-terminal cleavage/methylation domain-containing protein